MSRLTSLIAALRSPDPNVVRLSYQATTPRHAERALSPAHAHIAATRQLLDSLLEAQAIETRRANPNLIVSVELTSDANNRARRLHTTAHKLAMLIPTAAARITEAAVIAARNAATEVEYHNRDHTCINRDCGRTLRRVRSEAEDNRYSGYCSLHLRVFWFWTPLPPPIEIPGVPTGNWLRVTALTDLIVGDTVRIRGEADWVRHGLSNDFRDDYGVGIVTDTNTGRVDLPIRVRLNGDSPVRPGRTYVFPIIPMEVLH